jgi:hypothetical protein
MDGVSIVASGMASFRTFIFTSRVSSPNLSCPLVQVDRRMKRADHDAMRKLKAKAVASPPSKSKVRPSKRPRTKPDKLGLPSNEELLELAKKHPVPKSFWEGDDDPSRPAKE